MKTSGIKLTPLRQTICLLTSTAILACTAHPVQASRLYPVDGGRVTSGEGWRIDPFGSGKMVFHQGLDIAVPVGTPVHPTQTGTVIFAGEYKGYGRLVAVEHGKGYVTLYGHNSEVLVKPGQQVDTTTVLALSGNSGHSTGPHVHYEVRQMHKPATSPAKARSELTEVVKENIDGWVGKIVAGQGDGETGPILTVSPAGSRRDQDTPALVP